MVGEGEQRVGKRDAAHRACRKFLSPQLLRDAGLPPARLHMLPCHRYCTFDLFGEKKTGLCDPTNGHCYDVYKFDSAVTDMQARAWGVSTRIVASPAEGTPRMRMPRLGTQVLLPGSAHM